MKRVLRGCQATAAALVLCGLSPAYAGDLAWQFSQDDELAFLGVTDPTAGEDNQTYPFYMSCAVTGDETTVISDVDAKALGASIAKGEVPSITFILDGKPQDGGAVPVDDIRFDEMAKAWQYMIAGADYDTLLTAKDIKIKGAGVDMQLPQKDMVASLQQLKDACDALLTDNGGDGTDQGGGDSGSGGNSGN